MKKILFITAVLGLWSTTYAQESVTNRNGKEIIVNKDASTTSKGIIKLGGDLGGTADSPTVPTLTNKLDGSGTINYISKFSAAKTLTDSQIFDNGTNLGIGTTSPVSKFEVSGTSETFTANGTVRISNNTAPTINNFAGLVFKSNNVSGTGGSWKIGSNQETTTGSNQNFHFLNSYNGSAYASKMVITPSGYLGLGTTNPTSRFSNTATQIIGSNGQSSSSTTGFAWANSNTGWGGAFWSDHQGLNVKVKNTSTLAFEVGSGIAAQNDNAGAGGSTPLFNVLTNGNVGIGTNVPTAQLHVKGDFGGILLERTAGVNPYDQAFVKFMNKDGGSFQLRSSSGVADGFHITNSNATTTYITGLSSGNIGIGTTTPANKLEITQGTSGNSGLRFTNLNSSSTASTSLSKVLAVNSTGDVILTNVPGTQNTIAFSTATPTTSGVVFTPNTPADQSVVYQSSANNSMWTYNGTTYVTYNAPASTAWFTSGTTNDAGNSKTSNIYRTGSLGIGATQPVSKLEVIQSSLFSNNEAFPHGLVVATGKTNTDYGFYMGADKTSGLGYVQAINWGTYYAPFSLNPRGGNVGVGIASPTAQFEVATTNTLSTVIRRADATPYTSANIVLQKTFSTDPAVSTAVGSGDYIGRILFSASNGTATYPSTGPDIVGFALGTQTASANGGGLIFRTVRDGSKTVLERLKIDHNGNVGIGVIPPSSTGTLIGNPASILDIKSDNSGVLIPRMTTTQRTAISVSALLDALLVYDTDVRMFYYYNAGTSSWTPINVGTINSQTGSYTLTAADNGRVIDINSATAVTLTVPSTLPVGFQVSITQAGAGQVTITGGSGMTVNNRYSATRTSGQWAKAGLEVRASGSSVLSGDVQ